MASWQVPLLFFSKSSTDKLSEVSSWLHATIGCMVDSRYKVSIVTGVHQTKLGYTALKPWLPTYGNGDEPSFREPKNEYPWPTAQQLGGEYLHTSNDSQPSLVVLPHGWWCLIYQYICLSRFRVSLSNKLRFCLVSFVGGQACKSPESCWILHDMLGSGTSTLQDCTMQHPRSVIEDGCGLLF